MTVDCRLDGTQSRVAGNSSLETLILTSLSDALGMTDLDALLGHLLQSWSHATGAEIAALAVQDDTARGYRAGMVTADGVLSRLALRCPPSADIAERLVEDVLPRLPNIQQAIPREEFVPRLLVDGSGGRPVGAMLLVRATPLPGETDRLFTMATTALLRRAAENGRMLRDAKLASLGEFAAGAGHEINNPLAAISGRTQLLLRDEQDPERRRHLTTIGAQALRIRDMIGDTMLFARPPAPEPQGLDFSEVLDTTLHRFAERLASCGLVVQRECEADLPIWADATQLAVVVSELVRNAIDVSPPGGIIRIKACRESVGGPDWVRFSVRDEGPGLTAESSAHLFDPFYSGRPAGRGLGFGLSKCWRIVTNHGGQIDVEDGLERGFGMTVRWPTPQDAGV
ncbi:MAG: sensor histidine kinase [Planctomycetaceae bacterium]